MQPYARGRFRGATEYVLLFMKVRSREDKATASRERPVAEDQSHGLSAAFAKDM